MIYFYFMSNNSDQQYVTTAENILTVTIEISYENLLITF